MSDSGRGPKRLFAEDDPFVAANREEAPPADLEARILSSVRPEARPSEGWKLALGGIVIAGVAIWWMRSTPATVSADPARPRSIASAAAAPATETAPIEEKETTPAPSTALRPAPVRARAFASAMASSAPTGGLAAEIKALDAVRTSMKANDATAALSGLDDYDHAFREGTLKQEAVLLRVDALMRAGRADEARTLGHAFLAEHPTTPHRKRVQTILREE